MNTLANIREFKHLDRVFDIILQAAYGTGDKAGLSKVGLVSIPRGEVLQRALDSHGLMSFGRVS